MSKIIEFNSKKDFKDYSLKEARRKVGGGSEGGVYLTKDKEVIKIMLNPWEAKHYDDYKDIIMEDDLKLNSFIFPKELYIAEGLIVGYKEKYFKDDVFNIFNTSEDINIDMLIKARNKMIEDTKVITDKGYELFELPRNLMFNNKDLVAIDTLDYKKKKDINLEENIDIIDYSILLELSDIYEDIDCNGTFKEEIQKVYKR